MSSWSLQARKKLDQATVVWSTRTGPAAFAVAAVSARACPRRHPSDSSDIIFSAKNESGRSRTCPRYFGKRTGAWIRRTARRSFIHLGKSMLEVMLMTPAKLAQIARLQGADNLAKALAMGKGVIYVTGHVGNWELCGGVIASRFPLSVVAAPIEPEAAERSRPQLRNRLGHQDHPSGKTGRIQGTDTHIQGKPHSRTSDRSGYRCGRSFVDFMGRPAWTPTAAASMAIKFGAPVVFGYCPRAAITGIP